MLGINIEFRKGILFVRLKGILDKFTLQRFNDEVSSLIKDNGFKYIVMNLNHLKYIDDLGSKQLINDYRYVASINGKVIVCGIDENIVKEKNLEYSYISNNELEAFNLINI